VAEIPKKKEVVMADLQSGWFPDPSGDVSKLRYWDGTQWTEHYADAGAPQAPPPKKKKTLLFILIGAGVLVILGVVLVLVFTLGNSNTPDPNQNNNTNTATTDPLAGDNNNSTTNNSNNNNNNNNNNTSTFDIPEVLPLADEVTGQLGVKYEIWWGEFSVNSMHVIPAYESHKPASGNTLVMFNVTMYNTDNSPHPIGTFDWFIMDETLDEVIFPIDPLKDNTFMMPSSVMLDPGLSVSHDVIIEFPENLKNPQIMFFDADYEGNIFKIIVFNVK